MSRRPGSGPVGSDPDVSDAGTSRPGRALGDRSPRARRSGRGLVTAEFAVAIVAALGLLIALLAGVQLVILQVRCIDVAAAVARQAARGDEAAVRQARSSAPSGTGVEVRRSDDLVSVTVTLSARPLAGVFPPVPLRADAQVLAEPEGQ